MTQTLQQLIDTHKRIVFFGGAGVSTESGIPDFRSVDGLYNQKYDWPPETMLSRSFFFRHPKQFFDFYRDKMLFEGIEPNLAHKKLAELEQAGKLTAVITQNIDGLHQAAGSKAVFELHGSVRRNYCMECGQFHDMAFMKNSEGIPSCTKCGGVVKPDVVLYEEPLDKDVMNGAIARIENADMMIVGGTSLVVYPAAGLLDYFKGDALVLINRDPTPFDYDADLVIHDSIGKVLGEIRV